MMMSPACTEEANNRLPNLPGCLETQPDTRRNLADVGAGILENTHFGRFFAIVAIFQPLWRHSETPEEPKLLVKVPFDFQGEYKELFRSGNGAPNIEICLCREVSLFWACQLHDFWSAGRIPHSCLRVIFNVWEEPPVHASLCRL